MLSGEAGWFEASVYGKYQYSAKGEFIKCHNPASLPPKMKNHAGPLVRREPSRTKNF
jgi:hypothetical protein